MHKLEGLEMFREYFHKKAKAVEVIANDDEMFTERRKVCAELRKKMDKYIELYENFYEPVSNYNPKIHILPDKAGGIISIPFPDVLKVDKERIEVTIANAKKKLKEGDTDAKKVLMEYEEKMSSIKEDMKKMEGLVDDEAGKIISILNIYKKRNIHPNTISEITDAFIDKIKKGWDKKLEDLKQSGEK
jgi:hypothetical protein